MVLNRDFGRPDKIFPFALAMFFYSEFVIFIKVNGNWSEWGVWKECTVTCGGGNSTRSRTCTEPLPQHGGEYCPGNDTEVDNCNDNPCPSKYLFLFFLNIKSYLEALLFFCIK